VGSVAGGILGAKLGIEAIPISWIEALSEREKLEEMVGPLLEKYYLVSEDKIRF
jgi:ADP-ribosylglycohydrolase